MLSLKIGKNVSICFSARAAVLLTFLALLHDCFSVPFWICLVEQKKLELSCSTTVGSYSILAGERKSSSPVSKDWRLLCLPWLTYACAVQKQTYLYLGSKLHSRVYPGAKIGRSRHRRISVVSQDISDSGIKELASFSSKEHQFRQVKKLLWWTACCKGLQRKAASQCTFGKNRWESWWMPKAVRFRAC